jgi:stealth protein CR2/Stealth-like protein
VRARSIPRAVLRRLSTTAPGPVVRSVRWVRERRLRAGLPAGMAAEVMVSWWAGEPRVSLPLPGGDVDRAGRENRETVGAALTAAGVTFFDVPLRGSWGSRVGVPATQRDRVLRALAALPPTTYVAAAANGHGALGPRRVASASVAGLGASDRLEVWSYFVEPSSGLRLGQRYACQVELWGEHEDHLVATAPNPLAGSVPVAAVLGGGSGADGGPDAGRAGGPVAVPLLSGPAFDTVTFPVDVVYTWVDGSDPAWAARRAAALGEDAAPRHRESDGEWRFRDREELRYSLRSVLRHLPWVRQIHVVTDRQTPPWLLEDPRVRVVDHAEILDPAVLPTFNSHAIESALHRVPGLAEHFLYLNDDVFVARPLTPETFFLGNGMSRMFLSRSTVEPAGGFDPGSPQLLARRHTQRLLEELTGRSAHQVFKHTPHAFRRSVLEELAALRPDELGATAAHRFRDPEDVVLVWLYHYYAYFTGRAVPGSITYGYFDPNRGRDRRQMRELVRRRTMDTFCLNDLEALDLEPEDLAANVEFMQRFLERMYPEPSPVERPTPESLAGPRVPDAVDGADEADGADGVERPQSLSNELGTGK